jgi:hypothetical protein
VFSTLSGEIEIVKVFVKVTAGLSESVTSMAKVASPEPLGVPLMAHVVPVAVHMLSPPGSAPELRDQVYGGVPPLAERAVLYATPRLPGGSGEAVVMFRVSTVRLSVTVAVFAVGVVESVTSIVIETVPEAVGVPSIVPVPVLRPSPA